MIVKLFWLYHYYRFTRKWRDYPIADIYQNKEYFDSLYKLLISIPDHISESLFVSDSTVLTCFTNVELFSKQLEYAIRGTKYRSLTNQPNYNIEKRTLRDFLISDDGRPAIYSSSIRVLGNQLNRLYEEVEAVDKSSRDYYYIQLKELFICGISVCLTHIQEYV